MKPDKKQPLRKRLLREVVSWAWVLAAFLLIHGTLMHGRVIPSVSMEKTLLVGDHLLINRFGYDAELPFTGLHTRLWREPQRGQLIVFRSVVERGTDLVKRVIGVPGDRVEIRGRAVWLNGRPLEEPYLHGETAGMDDYGPVTVPADHYFVMGDNRANSFDSRYWGFLPREAVVGTPVVIYMSLKGPGEVWEPGHVSDRIGAYLHALVRPHDIRWKRLFTTF